MNAGLSSSEVSDRLGWDRQGGSRRLWLLIHEGVIVPSVHHGHASGDHHRWSEDDVLVIAAVTSVWPPHSHSHFQSREIARRRALASALRETTPKRWFAFTWATKEGITTDDPAEVARWYLDTGPHVTTVIDLHALAAQAA